MSKWIVYGALPSVVVGLFVVLDLSATALIIVCCGGVVVIAAAVWFMRTADLVRWLRTVRPMPTAINSTWLRSPMVVTTRPHVRDIVRRTSEVLVAAVRN